MIKFTRHNLQEFGKPHTMEYVTKQRQILGISFWPISKTTCKYNYSYHHHEFSLPSHWLIGKLYTCIFWFFSIKFSQQIFIGTNYLHLQSIISWYSNTVDFFFFLINIVEFLKSMVKVPNQKLVFIKTFGSLVTQIVENPSPQFLT